MQDSIRSEFSTTQNNSFENYPRDFKGIWIPKDVWLDRTLGYFEKCLLAEINSLDGKDGCFASNAYLAKLFQESERKIQAGLSTLKARGYIYQEAFNGRIRTLRTNMQPDKTLFNTSATQAKENDKTLFNTPGVSDSAPLDTGSAYIIEDERKDERKDIMPNRTSSSSADVEENKINFNWDSKKFERITQEKIKAWKEAFPHVDIENYLKFIEQDINLKPTKYKRRKCIEQTILIYLKNQEEAMISREKNSKHKGNYKNDYSNKSNNNRGESETRTGIFVNGIRVPDGPLRGFDMSLLSDPLPSV